MPVSVFTSQVELQQNYKSVFRKKVVLGRTEYETDEHVLLKLLAWLLFFHPRIVIEKKMEGDFEPDLILEDYDGTVKLWIECGRVSVNKLDKLTRRYPDARLYVLLASERDIPMMVKNIEKKVERLSRIRLVAFKEKVVDSLLPVFSDRNEIWCNVSWPEGVEDPVSAGAIEFEMTMNGTWVHSGIAVKILKD